MALSYGLLNSLRAARPTSIGEYASEARDKRMKAAEFEQNSRLNDMKMQDAQETMTSNRRSRAISVLNGLSGVQDPERRRELYGTLKSVATRLDPSLELPDEYDEGLVGALATGTISPEKQAELDLANRRVDDAAMYRDMMLQDRMAQKNNKPLPESATKRIETASTNLDALDRLNSTFDDQYGGNAFGGLENFAGRFGGEVIGAADQGQAQWWQDYQGFQNQIRNDLFGSALTATEKAEFEKAMITPGMAPAQIRANLARQAEIAQRAAVKLSQYYKANGYRAEPIDVMLPQGGAPAAGAGGGQIIDFNDLPD